MVKQTAEDIATGIRYFGITDREIFEKYVHYSKLNKNQSETEINRNIGLEQEISGVA